MGTFKKWVLASLVSVMMVLTFAIGLLPSLGSLGVSAANGERIDFAGLLAKQLGIGKQLQSVEITFPEDGATVLVLPNANNINLPIRARVTPTDAAADVTFGVDGDGTGALTWTGDITSTTVSSAPFIATVNLKQLGDGLFGVHEIYGLANAAKASLAYEVLDVIEIDVQPLFELNGDGRPNNPFALLGPGDLFSSTFDDPNTGNTRHVFIADLDVDPNTKALGDLGTVIIPAQVGSLLITVATAGLQEFVDAGVIPSGADAALLVEIAPDLETLLGGVEGLAAANALYDYPNKELAFGAQFVTIAITYSSDNGVTVNEVGSLAALPVRLTVEGLAAKQLDTTSGVGVWAIPTDISNTNVPSVDEVAGWDKRAGSTLDTFNATLEIYLDRLSVFAALETELAISSIYPEDGAALQPPLVKINGSFPVAAAIDSAAAAAAAYVVYFGDQLASFEVADLVYGGSIVAASYMYVIPPVRADILSDLAVAVSVYDTLAPSDFIIAPAAYTHKFYGVPSITSIVPSVGPLTPVDPDNRVTITGDNLDGVINVIFDGVPGQIITAKVSSSIAVLPPSTNQAGTVEVFVITPGGSSAPGSYTYQAVPVITDIDPIEGADAGGDTVTITGSALSNATSVSIAGVPAASFTVDSDSQIRAVTSAAASGTTGSVVVTTPGGTSAPSAESFTYGSAPVVDAFDPAEGDIGGGESVVITGSGFTGATDVTLASIAATFEVYSDTEIRAVTGVAGAPTVGKVEVTTPRGTGASTGDFTYVDRAPVVSDFDPKEGPAAGGTVVVIAGSNFNGVTEVTIAGIAAVVGIYSDTEISVTTGAAAPGTVGKVVVTNAFGAGTSAADYTYTSTIPVVASFSPTQGRVTGGDRVVILGSGFTGATSVTLASIAATAIEVYNDGEIGAITGAAGGPTIGTVTVTTPAGSGTSTDNFSYVAAPLEITDFDPKTGSTEGGEPVTITGIGFSDAKAANSVTIAGVVATFTIYSDTRIDATTGFSATPTVGKVVVSTGTGIATSVADFTYLAPPPPPVIADFNPKQDFLAGGATVIITGSGLTGATGVTLAGLAAQSFTVDSATQITAVTAPSAAPADGPVTVTTPGGTATSVAVFSYVAVQPIITDFNPKVGFDIGGDTIVILGSGFIDATEIKIAGVTAASFIVNNDGEIHAVTSPAPDGTTGKVVVTTQFSEATSVANFVYIPSIVESIEITSITPDNAWVFGGVIARIDGNGFLQADLLDLTSVKFGGVQATVLEMTDDVLIVNVPAHAAGSATIEATRNNEVTPATLAEAFTYSDQVTAGGVTTTATTLTGGTGTVVINLGGTDGTATLVVPATVKPGTGDRKVLAQAYRDPLGGWTIPAAVVGTPVEDGFIFGIHLFADDPAFAGGTPAVGTITLVEGTSTLSDETASASYSIDNPALLTTPVGSLNLLKADIITGQVVAVGRASVLTHVTPGETPVVVAQGDVYQSQIANANFNELQSTVTDLENVAITSLGTLEIHKGASVDLDVNPTIILERISAKGGTSEILTSASVVQANDTIRATADEGGLAYIESVAIYSTSKGTVGTVITELDLVSDFSGEDAFSVTFQVPDLSGITDQPVTLAIFLPLDPDNNPSIVINNAFQITAAGTFPWWLILLGLGGLAIGGGDDGGGGGGPCFIATAAYGTPLAGEIETLRAVRDAFLLDNAFGTAFVDTYYRVSPAIADVVAQSPMLAAAVRIILTPVVFLGKLLLAAPALSILSVGLTMGMFWMLRRRSRKA